MANYGCTATPWPGGEQAFALSSDATQLVTIELAMTATWTVFDLTPNDAGLCAPNKCIATGSKLHVGLQPKRPRLLVVESMGAGEATLTVTCAPLPPGCGDLNCNYDGGESCASCPKDCGTCQASCPASAKPGCVLNPCEVCVCAQDAFCCKTAWDDACVGQCVACNAPKCGDMVCSTSENCVSCPIDCGGCDHLPPQCGDGKCAGTEHCATCPADCGKCGNFGCACQNDSYCCNNTFDSACLAKCAKCSEGPCPKPKCGDGLCWGSESCSSCNKDCGACPPAQCGDGKCNGSETCTSCSGDCGACPKPICGDGKCQTGETTAGCPGDCAPAAVGCFGHCGASSKDNQGVDCWCDDTCSATGDCCADKASYCP